MIPTSPRLPTLTVSPKAKDFIHDEAIWNEIRDGEGASAARVREIIAKSLEKKPLDTSETATLLGVTDPVLLEEIFQAARELKRTVYGNRIVLFAPLYIGNRCVNDCTYCGFRRSNESTIRRELERDAVIGQIKALEERGHKRLILVFGEHPDYDAQFMADSVRSVYEAGDIRRVNINAAPLDDGGYRIVKESKIGTYQIFQETYHHETYHKVHDPNTRKGHYLWRLDGLSRAFDAGIDDLGIGALFGLYDWRFEVMGLVHHAKYLVERHGVGPHTISFPRLKPAHGVSFDPQYLVSDENFLKLVAILRLSVPYTGMICTAREPAHIRDTVLGFGVSQIDAGTRIDMGGYTEKGDAHFVDQVPKGQATVKSEPNPDAQFEIGDGRSLDEMVGHLVSKGFIPSFCTSCYRAGRTGEIFMEYAIPGFIQKLCTPNALTTFQEYLCDHASTEVRAKGEKMIAEETARIPDPKVKKIVEDRLVAIKTKGERDLFL